jgi:peroxiredoxin
MTQLPSPDPEPPPVPAGPGTPASNLRRVLMTRILLLAVLLALLIGVFAVVREHGTSTPARIGATSARTPSTGSPGTQTPSRVLTAPDFTLPTLTGTTFHLAAKQGHVVVLYFMAPTCPSCAPDSHTLADTLLSTKRYGVQALAIDVNLEDRPGDLEAFIHSEAIPATAPVQWGIDTTGAITSAYGVLTLETTVVIDPKGEIAYQTNGAFPPDQLAQIIRSLA